jgi:hypothetical protein
LELGSQLHAPAALNPGKETPISIKRVIAGGSEEKRIPAPAWNRTPVVEPVVQSLCRRKVNIKTYLKKCGGRVGVDSYLSG